MNKNGPIIIIEDDNDDQALIETVFKKLAYPNQVIYFSDGQKALDFLIEGNVFPFLILSDISMPGVSGFELRQKIYSNAQLQAKCIPYLFFSNTASQQAVIDAYSLSAQGFFIKDLNIEKLEKTIDVIMKYWKKCAAPNNFNGFQD